MKITNLTYLGFILNAALDSGKYDHITIQEVRQRVEEGTILEYLNGELDHGIDEFSSPEDRAELVDYWQTLANVADSRRKFGVDRNGICLLVAYVLEGLQYVCRNAPDAPLR